MNKKSKVEHTDGDESSSLAGSPFPINELGYRTIDSRDVFGTASEVVILHQGTAYRLRVTRAGKLILNK